MAYHVFSRGGYETVAVIVEADSKTEAKGKLAEEKYSGFPIDTYQGTVAEVMSGDDVVDLKRL